MALLCFACVLSGFAYFGEGLVREAFFNTKPVTTKREASPVENIIKEGAIVARLNCTKDYEAAIVMKEYIDKKEADSFNE